MRVLASSTEADAALAVQRLLKLDNADEVFTKISKWTDKVDGPPRIYDDLPDACNSLVRLVNDASSFNYSNVGRTGLFGTMLEPDNATAVATILEALGDSNAQNLITAMGRSIPDAGAERNADIFVLLFNEISITGQGKDPYGWGKVGLEPEFGSIEEFHAYRMPILTRWSRRKRIR